MNAAQIKIYYSCQIFLLANLNEDKTRVIDNTLIWINPPWSRNENAGLALWDTTIFWKSSDRESFEGHGR